MMERAHATHQAERDILSMSAECSASSTPNGVVLGHDGSPKKAPRLKALPKVCADTGITTLAEAQTVLSQLDEIRTRVLRAFPEAEIANGGHHVPRRALRDPPLPGSVDDSYDNTAHEAMPVAYEKRVRDIVREEMVRWDPGGKHSPGENYDMSDSRSSSRDTSRLNRQFGRTPSRSCSPSGTRPRAEQKHVPTRVYSPHSPQRPLSSSGGAGRTSSATPRLHQKQEPKAQKFDRGIDGGFENKSSKRPQKAQKLRSPPTDRLERAPSSSTRGGTPTPSCTTSTSVAGADLYYPSDSDDSTSAQCGGEDGTHAADGAGDHFAPFSPIRERSSQEFGSDTDGERMGKGPGAEGAEGGKAGDGDADADKDADDDDDDDTCEWEKVSENAFGAFIHVALQSGIQVGGRGEEGRRSIIKDVQRRWWGGEEEGFNPEYLLEDLKRR